MIKSKDDEGKSNPYLIDWIEMIEVIDSYLMSH
jgi:hypothetical protein